MIKNIIKVLILFTLTIEVQANDSFLGVFTIDNYPVNNCSIIKAHNQILTVEESGTYNQYTKKNKLSYIDVISQDHLKKSLIEMAKKEGFNAIIGYKYYVFGGYDGFNGNNINGSIGIGVYRAGVMGNAVLVSCK